VFSVTAAENGERALAILEAQQVDAILTDLQMPVMDGLGLLGHLLERGIRVPVAVMTGQALTDQLQHRLQQFGIAASFSKPFEVAELADELQRSLSPKTVGRLTGVTIFGSLQLLEVEKKTVLIVVRSVEEDGRLYFDDGVLVHAETRWHRGLDAVYQVIGWPDPHIEIFYHRTTRERTIQDPLQHVLMEAARLLDESSRESVEVAEPSAPARASAAPVDPASPAIRGALDSAMEIEGALGVALVDSFSGMNLGASGGSEVINLELAATAAGDFIRAKQRAMVDGSAPDAIEDIVITLGTQYHVVRRLRSQPRVFLYLVLDRRRAILGMARQRLAALARRVSL